jgi:hypothetical protein
VVQVNIIFLIIFCWALFSPVRLSAQNPLNNHDQSESSIPVASVDGQKQGSALPSQIWDDSKNSVDVFNQAVKRLNIQTEIGPGIEKSPPRQKRQFKIPKQIFIFLGLVITVIVVFYIIRSYLKNKKTTMKVDDPSDQETAIDPQALLDTGLKADRLAEEGKIVEAMHAILLETIEELKRQKNLTFPTSHTSREIVYNLNLGLGATQCLGEIVNTVEPTWFGELKPNLGQYQSLRSKFDSFLALLGQSRGGHN